MHRNRHFSPKNILVRMPNWIGDLVMATPLLYDLRKRYQEASITAMCLKELAPLLEKDPALDALFCFSKGKGFLHRIVMRNIVEKLKGGNYDVAILTTNSFSSAWRLWQGNIKRRIGFKNEGRSLFLTDPVDFPKERKTQHLVKTYKTLLTPLNIPISDTKPKLYLDPEEKEEAWRFLKRFLVKKTDQLIGIHPGAAYGSAKCWVPERFRFLAQKLAFENPSCRILFFGDLSQSALIKQICLDLPSSAINLAGQTSLRQLLACMSLCSCFVTNDSGPMHMADSLDVPVVALFGSSDPTVTGPYSQEGRVIYKKVSCSPCFQRTCPIDFRCMKRIEVEEVFDQVMDTLKHRMLC